MNKQENQKRLRQSMAMLKIKIDNMKSNIETSDRLNIAYNKMLIEKAMLKKELDDIDKPKEGLFKKLSKFIRPSDKQIISDYFHS